MILLDCGNNRLKAQFHQEAGLRASYAAAYRGRWGERLTSWLEDFPAEHCFVTSVLDPDRQRELEQRLAARFGDAVTRFVSEARTLDVINAYPEPDRLGDDRWLALIAARELAAGDCIVIDAGSAMTLDLLRADGRHLGGAILPGINTSIESFKRIFSYIDFDDPALGGADEPGCSTVSAIRLDYAHSSLEILPGLIDRWSQKYLRDPSLLLAGGDAWRIQRETGLPGRLVPDLVFRGMLRLVRR